MGGEARGDACMLVLEAALRRNSDSLSPALSFSMCDTLDLRWGFSAVRGLGRAVVAAGEPEGELATDAAPALPCAFLVAGDLAASAA
jgi:hypothetical protein